MREASSCPRVVLAFPMSDTANTSSFFVPSSFSNFWSMLALFSVKVSLIFLKSSESWKYLSIVNRELAAFERKSGFRIGC